MHHASITKHGVKGYLVLQGEPPMLKPEARGYGHHLRHRMDTKLQRNQREGGIMSNWRIYAMIFRDPIHERLIHGKYSVCSNTHLKKSVKRESQSKLFSHLCMCGVL